MITLDRLDFEDYKERYDLLDKENKDLLAKCKDLGVNYQINFNKSPNVRVKIRS